MEVTMSEHTATRRYQTPQLVDRGCITKQTLMSGIRVVPEDNPEVFTAGTSI